MFTKLLFSKNQLSNRLGKAINLFREIHKLGYLLLAMLFFATTIWGIQEETTNDQAPSSKFHFSVGTGITSTSAGDDLVSVFGQSGLGGRMCFFCFCVDYPFDFDGNMNISLSADYNITDELRLCLVYIDNRTLEINGNYNTQENINISTFGLLLEYVFPRTVQSCFELAFGAGVNYSDASVEVFLDLSSGHQNQRTISEGLLGIHLRSSLDWYIWEFLSLQFKIDGKLLPSIEMPATILPTLYYEIKTLKAHDINMSSLNYALSLRLHF
jgi:hypothetical protein